MERRAFFWRLAAGVAALLGVGAVKAEQPKMLYIHDEAKDLPAGLATVIYHDIALTGHVKGFLRTKDTMVGPGGQFVDCVVYKVIFAQTLPAKG